MRRGLAAGVVGLVAIFGACAPSPHPVEAISTSEASPAADPETRLFRLAADALPHGRVQLSNGHEVSSSDWLTLVFAEFTGTDSHGRPATYTCSGALVGPNVLLTAAHCLDEGRAELRKAQIEVDGIPIDLVCAAPDAYMSLPYRGRSPRGPADYALCLIDYGQVTPAALSRLEFEVIEDEREVGARQAVLLTGYGCTNLRIENGELAYTRSRGVLRVGDDRVEAVAGERISARADMATEPALCPGDSGGPLLSGPSVANLNVIRRVRGVNSSILPEQSSDGRWDVVSRFASTGAGAFNAWATEWLTSDHIVGKGPVICGVNRNEGQHPCRD